MSNAILLYDNHSDAGTLSGGAWALPLTNMQDPRPTKRARSANLSPASTTWRAQLTAAKTLRAVVFGPTNLSGGATYRIRAFSDAAFSVLINDTGVTTIGAAPIDTLDADWNDAFWWSGAQPIVDPGGAAGGIWVVHVYAADVTAQYWQFDIDNQDNADGFFSVGRLFMGTAYIPLYNFEPNNNKFDWEENTTQDKAAGGTRYYNARRAARMFDLNFPVLPEAEIHDDVYKIAAIAGISKQVFLIPFPDLSADIRNQLSILGTLKARPTWSYLVADGTSGATGFSVVEAI